VDNTDQIVREYQGLNTATSIDSEGSREAAAQSENNLDTSTSDYHLDAPAAEYVRLDLTLSRPIVLERNVSYVAATPVMTAQSQGPAESGHFLESTSPSVSWNFQSAQNNSLSVSTFASSFLLDGVPILAAASETEVGLPISKTERTQLIHAYLQETGTWCETTDSGRHFTVSYVHKLMENKPFAAAAIAVASQQLDSLRHTQRQSTLQLYQHAVQSLLHYEPSQCGEATLATCILLSIYEMMTSDVSEWRHHLKVRLPDKIGGC
jgi:hypothetical protein